MKHNEIRSVVSSLLLLTVLGAVGCSTTIGDFHAKSRYVYPNSNVTVLGPVKGEVSRTWFLITPRLTVAHMEKAYNDALSQTPGANLIVTMKEDTTFTTFLFINSITYKIEGEAARMDVGSQQLK